MRFFYLGYIPATPDPFKDAFIRMASKLEKGDKNNDGKINLKKTLARDGKLPPIRTNEEETGAVNALITFSGARQQFRLQGTPLFNGQTLMFQTLNQLDRLTEVGIKVEAERFVKFLATLEEKGDSGEINLNFIAKIKRNDVLFQQIKEYMITRIAEIKRQADDKGISNESGASSRAGEQAFLRGMAKQLGMQI